MIAKRKIRILWIVWLILWPLALWFSTTIYYINFEGQIIDIIIFAIFMSILALFPLTINNNQIFFTNGISIAIFLLFGLFIEILLSQLTILIVLLSTGLRKDELYRVPLNMLSFLFISFVGAEVYFHLGGTHGAINSQSITEVSAVLGYAGTIFLMNQICNKLIENYFFKRKIEIIDQAMKWEFASLLLILPVGFVLFLLYVEIGTIGIFYLGIPFIFISIILRLLYSYQQINQYLKQTGEIGHKLTKRLNMSEVYEVFIQELIKLFPIDSALIYIVTEHNQLELVRFHGSDESANIPLRYLNPDEKVSGKVWVSGKPVIYGKTKDQIILRELGIPSPTRSLLSLPVHYGDNIVGIMTVASKKQNFFEETHYKILDIITTYLGIAIENARNFELTRDKGEKDGLTDLYNFYYFEEFLNNADVNKIYSLLLLDLDHFKKVNDTYGHEAGNEILREVSKRIKDCIGDKGLIARYGGEEFAILLFDTDTDQASHIGEYLRTVIVDYPFLVCGHLSDQNSKQNVDVTASIGISTYPDHCENLRELIRHADRAMYNGAKNSGRNKVAVCEKV